MKIDVGSMKSMLSIVNSLVGTKPACHLSESDKHYISVLVIKVLFSFYFLLYYIDQDLTGKRDYPHETYFDKFVSITKFHKLSSCQFDWTPFTVF